MLLLTFLLFATVLNLVLGFLVQFKSYRVSHRMVLLGLSGIYTAYLWIAYFAVFAESGERWFRLNEWLLALSLVSALGMLELARGFLRDGIPDPALSFGRVKVSLFSMASVAAGLGLGLILVPGQILTGGSGGDRTLRFEGMGALLPTFHVLMDIYVLYLLESTYRFAQDYQRRIGRLCFIGLGVLAAYHVFTFARILLYRSLPLYFAEGSSVIYGVVYPVILAGFFRYRLGSERIAVPRDTVYASATVFLTGAAFLGVALTVFAFQWFRLDFTYFERFLLAFTLCFLAVLVMGSGTMRRRITRFVDKQIYSRKYDYREQFFRLHRTLMSGADVHTALTDLVENMKYSVNVDDAYVFVLDWQDGNFYQHENKEEATRRGLVVSGDSPLARLLAAEGEPVDLLDGSPASRVARETALSEPLVQSLKFDAVFPVFIDDRLAGMLALQGGRHRPFEQEDASLIGVFTNFIGDALFKHRVLKERIEQKQFESFHHVASFIIHDIKNQIATLTLLLKNAERNLGNPSFQASMMSSIKSCSANLQSLIDKLAVAPKWRQGRPGQDITLGLHPLRPLIQEAIDNAGLAALPGLAVELKGEGDTHPAPMDRHGLFFVLRNLLNNALEAMEGQGRIGLTYGLLGSGPGSLPAPARLRNLFGGGDQFFSGFSAFVLVEDNGAGMREEFVKHRLFQPFATTKEKGVGIGLYQCKTMVEGMGGRILCHSELGKGSEFCILLPLENRGAL